MLFFPESSAGSQGSLFNLKKVPENCSPIFFSLHCEGQAYFLDKEIRSRIWDWKCRIRTLQALQIPKTQKTPLLLSLLRLSQKANTSWKPHSPPPQKKKTFFKRWISVRDFYFDSSTGKGTHVPYLQIRFWDHPLHLSERGQDCSGGTADRERLSRKGGCPPMSVLFSCQAKYLFRLYNFVSDMSFFRDHFLMQTKLGPVLSFTTAIANLSELISHPTVLPPSTPKGSVVVKILFVSVFELQPLAGWGFSNWSRWFSYQSPSQRSCSCSCSYRRFFKLLCHSSLAHFGQTFFYLKSLCGVACFFGPISFQIQ